ncbi:pentatricopeptide repeat-containing protein At5g55740, chloroplastic-like [Nymphaea colorata]|nr:pentatricopeptide repeat-containing protein At5g55740, chloroplastic-like [Nymphaea colorata]
MYEEVIVTCWRVRDEGVYPDDYVFLKVLRACTQLSDLEEGVQVHNDMKHLGLRPNVCSSNSLIELYSKCGDVVSTRRMFDEMSQRDVLPWNSMIAGYVSTSIYDSALELFNLMCIGRARPDLITWNTILTAYSQHGLLEEALDILNHIKECGYTMPNHVTWTTLTVGHARKGCYRKALELFKEMLDANVSPNADSLSCVISACKNLHAFRSGREAHGYGIRTCLDHKFYASAGGALVTRLFSMWQDCRCGKCFHNLSSLPTTTSSHNFELAFGDVTDLTSLLEAFSGCDVLFHTAAIVEPWVLNPSVLFTVNVEGLRNVLLAFSPTSSMQKMVYTSSFFALGPTDGCIGNEMQIIEHFSGRLPGYVGKGNERFCFSHVDDVIHGHIAALDRGKIGERYLLGGENASFADVFDIAAMVTGTQRPSFHIPLWLVEIYGWMSVFWARLTGTIPLISYPIVLVMRHQWVYSSDKAKEELNYKPRNLKEGLTEVMTWLKSVGKINY